MLSSHSATLCTPYAKGNELFLDGAKKLSRFVVRKVFVSMSYLFFKFLLKKAGKTSNKHWEYLGNGTNLDNYSNSFFTRGKNDLSKKTVKES